MLPPLLLVMMWRYQPDADGQTTIVKDLLNIQTLLRTVISMIIGTTTECTPVLFSVPSLEVLVGVEMIIVKVGVVSNNILILTSSLVHSVCIRSACTILCIPKSSCE